MIVIYNTLLFNKIIFKYRRVKVSIELNDIYQGIFVIPVNTGFGDVLATARNRYFKFLIIKLEIIKTLVTEN